MIRFYDDYGGIFPRGFEIFEKIFFCEILAIERNTDKNLLITCNYFLISMQLYVVRNRYFKSTLFETHLFEISESLMNL